MEILGSVLLRCRTDSSVQKVETKGKGHGCVKLEQIKSLVVRVVCRFGVFIETVSLKSALRVHP